MPPDPAYQAMLVGLDRRRDIFERLYLREKMGLLAVSERMGVRFAVLLTWARHRKIPLRTPADAYETRRQRNEVAQEIVRLRLQERLTQQAIADQLGIRNRSGVQQMLKRRGLAGDLEDMPSWEEYLERNDPLSVDGDDNNDDDGEDAVDEDDNADDGGDNGEDNEIQRGKKR